MVTSPSGVTHYIIPKDIRELRLWNFLRFFDTYYIIPKDIRELRQSGVLFTDFFIISYQKI